MNRALSQPRPLFGRGVIIEPSAGALGEAKNRSSPEWGGTEMPALLFVIGKANDSKPRRLRRSSLKKLHSLLVLHRLLPRRKRSEIPPLAGLRIDLPRIQTVFARLQFANHDVLLFLWMHQDKGAYMTAEKSKNIGR